MMIQSMQSYAVAGSSSSSSSPKLSAEKTAQLSDVLQKYDPSSMTSSDAKAMVSEISNLGIQPGKALESAMAAEGFDAKSVGDMAGVGGGMPPPPPPQSSGINSDALDMLMSILEEYSSSSSSSDTDISALLEQLKESMSANQNIVDIKV